MISHFRSDDKKLQVLFVSIQSFALGQLRNPFFYKLANSFQCRIVGYDKSRIAVVFSMLVRPVALEFTLYPPRKQSVFLSVSNETLCGFNSDRRTSAAKRQPKLFELVKLP